MILSDLKTGQSGRILGLTDAGLLAKRLLERGLDETILNQIFWSNALGVIDKCSM